MSSNDYFAQSVPGASAKPQDKQSIVGASVVVDTRVVSPFVQVHSDGSKVVPDAHWNPHWFTVVESHMQNLWICRVFLYAR